MNKNAKHHVTTPEPRLLTIHRDQMQRYSAHGTLIPLHRYDATSARNGTIRKDGKRPIHNDWTKRDYPSAAKVIAHCEKHNRNVGVRLPADVVVIDIDPRNGGDEGWDNLTLELGLDEAIFPCVITGSGGRHYYARKPADVPVVDTPDRSTPTANTTDGTTTRRPKCRSFPPTSCA
jgi:hypothetical protein